MYYGRQLVWFTRGYCKALSDCWAEWYNTGLWLTDRQHSLAPRAKNKWGWVRYRQWQDFWGWRLGVLTVQLSPTKSQTQTVIHSTQPSTTQLLLKINRRFIHTDSWKIKRLTESLDWIEQCFTSPPTQYRLYGRRFLQVKRHNQQYSVVTFMKPHECWGSSKHKLLLLISQVCR